MKKITAEIKINYIYDSTRKGAKYSTDGEHFMNGGEFAEIIAKAVLGYESRKDANTAFDKGSDIPEIEASVKSSKATLVNKKLADTFEGSIKEYFKATHSKIFIYVVIIDDTATLYMMNANEFESFIKAFAGMNERGFIRFKGTSAKTIAWLESAAA